jgi:hypothetical protein
MRTNSPTGSENHPGLDPCGIGFPFDAAPHHMMQRSRSIQSPLSRNTGRLDLSLPFVKLF